MSNFGKNIRKIRTLKKLSQAEFANLFELNRGNISAYEEERSEAKIDTIIGIANHFSISIDDLLIKELTIDEIYHIDKIRLSHQLVNRLKPAGISIRFLNKQKLRIFPNYYGDKTFLENLPFIQIAGFYETNLLALEVDRQLSDLEWNIEAEDVLIIKNEAKPKEKVKNKLFLQISSGGMKFCIFDTLQQNYLGAFEIVGIIKVKFDTFYNQLIKRIERIEASK
ncbi:MAG: helix-turn-helix domain-containing protein [Bacteroidales bacterium]|nr:helix-turn-helix domain-containing protein [Bacteroidales bacterium]